MRRLALAGAVLLATMAALAAPARTTPALTPMQYTRTTLEQVNGIMASGATHNEKLADLSKVFNNFLDTDAMARAALGSHWAIFNPAQRVEFLKLFHVMIERAYVQKLMLFENPKFEYVGEIAMNAGARVDTKIVTPGDKFSVAYELRAEGDRWMATSITVEKVNLISNYAAQLNRLLSRSPVEDVLALMRRKYGGSGTVK